MGSCCAAETKEGQGEGGSLGVHPECTMPSYDDWAESLIGDLGSDATAIPRDFPRMDILIFNKKKDGEEDGEEEEDKLPPYRQPEDPKPEGTVTYDKDPEAALRIRRDRVIDSLVGIVALVEEIECSGDTSTVVVAVGAGGSEEDEPPALPLAEPKGSPSSKPAVSNTSSLLGATATSSIGSSLSVSGPPIAAAAVRQFADDIVTPDQSDLSHSLAETFLASGLTMKNPEYIVPDPTGHQKVERTTIQKRPYLAAPGCLAFDALLCFSQAVMFYPSQYLKRLLWEPWGQHLQDLGWTGTVFTRKVPPSASSSSFSPTSALVVWHEQTLRNHLGMLDDDEIKHTPQFKVSWRLEIVMVHKRHASKDNQVYTVVGGESGEQHPEEEKDAENEEQKDPETAGGGERTLTSGNGQLRTAFIHDVNLIVSSWNWEPRLDKDGKEVTKKPSSKYREKKSRFEQRMFHNFGLAPGEVNSAGVAHTTAAGTEPRTKMVPASNADEEHDGGGRADSPGQAA